MTLVVDIHSHLYPDWFVDLFRARTEVPRVVADGDSDRFRGVGRPLRLLGAEHRRHRGHPPRGSHLLPPRGRR